MLQAGSPTKVRVCPARAPRCSRMVSRSASAWHGWNWSVSALTTGTPANGGHLLEPRLLVRAPHDHRGLAAQHPRGVGDRLADADLGQRAVDDHREAAELGDARARRTPACAGSACRRAPPPCADRPAVESSYGAALSFSGEARGPAPAARGQVVVAQEVARHAGRRAGYAASRMAGHAARNESACSAVRTSGGASRTRSGVGLLTMKPASRRGGEHLGGRGLGQVEPDQQPGAAHLGDPVVGDRVRRAGAGRRSVACSSRPSFSIVSSTARAAAEATGLPPNVVPWLPGWSRSAASPVARQAPIGKPPARPLATVTMSATPSIGSATAGFWWANQAPVRPIAGLDLVEPEQRAVLAGDLRGPGPGSRAAVRPRRPRPAAARGPRRRSRR